MGVLQTGPVVVRGRRVGGGTVQVRHFATGELRNEMKRTRELPRGARCGGITARHACATPKPQPARALAPPRPWHLRCEAAGQRRRRHYCDTGAARAGAHAGSRGRGRTAHAAITSPPSSVPSSPWTSSARPRRTTSSPSRKGSDGGDRRRNRAAARRSRGALFCLLYTSPSPRDRTRSRMPSSA